MKKTVVFEDATMAYNRWVQGIASREMSSTQVPLRDLVDKRSNQLPGETNALVWNHPILDGAPGIVGSAIMSISALRQKLSQARGSNLASDPVKKQHLLYAMKYTKASLENLSAAIKHLEKI